ncbi:hypothetical protein RA27_17435 [Ruegeria sp. ANG-R]|uniref:hypothetical protein n=1 Tax=Ruegeria sp. ANG-R TaxID=1577903 RepID=UPI00057ED4F6|nr:hypothetical protein [Ruegeria sp. ANG-R]KIC39833.1 hypothetical protein RA27_17435 [Ruegeria sp. ANG-R]
MTSVTVLTQLHCAAIGTIELPPDKTWDDVADWYIKWGCAHLAFTGGETAEIGCNPQAGDVINWKRPIHTDIYANDASGRTVFDVLLDERD